MKKHFIRVILLCVCCVSIFGCAKVKTVKVEGTLEEIMEKVYQEIPEADRPMMLANTVVTKENAEYYIGSADIEFESALASETKVGSIAHSVVLLRTKEGADIESVKKTIKEKVNPRKWICVGVEPSDVVVKNKGDLVILIMSELDKDKLEKGFDNLKEA